MWIGNLCKLLLHLHANVAPIISSMIAVIYNGYEKYFHTIVFIRVFIYELIKFKYTNIFESTYIIKFYFFNIVTMEKNS